MITKKSHPDEQIFATRLLANAKQAVALEPITALLDDPRIQVAEAAAEALGEIGDSEARTYLEMTAQGHEIE